MSELILKKIENKQTVSSDIYQNLLVALVSLLSNNERSGPNTENLSLYLSHKYVVDEHGPGFDLGAVYGALEVYETFKKIKSNKKEDSQT